MSVVADPSYPLGRFDRTTPRTPETRRAAIEHIAAMPRLLRRAVDGLSDAQLDTPYRAGGWTVRQLVHHVADSHMNGYIRLKLALTEENPTVKPYQQDAWARLPDSRLSLAGSLGIIDGVHDRWAALWRSLGDDDFGRAFTHPENGELTIDEQLHLYAWHSRHHVAHITALRDREGW